MPQPTLLQLQPVETALERFVLGVANALPDVLAGLVFLVVAVVLVKVALWLLERVLERTVPGESIVYRQFVRSVAGLFLWFGVSLAFLSIVGLDQLAAALGTATGFLALGISYALSGMLADVVAGLYLLRDPDFNPGDTVTAGDMTGEVLAIELRKTRFDVEDDVVVRANAEIEKRWRKHDGELPTDAA